VPGGYIPNLGICLAINRPKPWWNRSWTRLTQAWPKIRRCPNDSLPTSFFLVISLDSLDEFILARKRLKEANIRGRERERKREKERKLASLPYLIRSNFISSGEQERYQHFSFLSLEVSFGSLRERERETVDNFPEITRNRKKKKTINGLCLAVFFHNVINCPGKCLSLLLLPDSPTLVYFISLDELERKREKDTSKAFINWFSNIMNSMKASHGCSGRTCSWYNRRSSKKKKEVNQTSDDHWKDSRSYGHLFLLARQWRRHHKRLADERWIQSHDWLTSDLSFFSFYPMWPWGTKMKKTRP